MRKENKKAKSTFNGLQVYNLFLIINLHMENENKIELMTFILVQSFKMQNLNYKKINQPFLKNSMKWK